MPPAAPIPPPVDAVQSHTQLPTAAAPIPLPARTTESAHMSWKSAPSMDVADLILQLPVTARYGDQSSKRFLADISTLDHSILNTSSRLSPSSISVSSPERRTPLSLPFSDSYSHPHYHPFIPLTSLWARAPEVHESQNTVCGRSERVHLCGGSFEHHLIE